MGFQHLSDTERKKVAAKGGMSSRKPELQKAWAIADKIKSDFNSGKKNAGQLADELGINKRMVYRIVRGK